MLPRILPVHHPRGRRSIPLDSDCTERQTIHLAPGSPHYPGPAPSTLIDRYGAEPADIVAVRDGIVLMAQLRN